MRRLSIIGLVTWLGVAAHAADQAPQWLGQGQKSTAYRVAQPSDPRYRHMRVLKVIRRDATQIRVAARKPGSLAELHTMRKVLADQIVEVAQKLRADREFRARFGDVIPDSVSLVPGEVLQEEARGVKYHKLSSVLRTIALAEIDAARAMARRILPGMRTSRAVVNFRFDPQTGRLTSWYDQISDSRNYPFGLAAR